MSERERNKALLLMLYKLRETNDVEQINLVRYLLRNDTPAMKKSFNIMCSNCEGVELFEIKL